MNIQLPFPDDTAFGIAPEHSAIRATAERFASESLAPLSRRIEADDEIPVCIRRRKGALGLIGLELPEEPAPSFRSGKARTSISRKWCRS